MVFSIGPVQGFIAQSRRTADGWVGSYLLSYIMGHALAAVEEGEAKIIEPDPDIAMFKAIKDWTGTKVDGDTTIGALPNTAVLSVQSGQEDTIGERAKTAAEEEGWGKVHKAIWAKLPDTMKTCANVQGIWDRQVKAPWELYWAWGDDSDAAFKNLAARKGLRDFSPVAEGGDRCMVCAEREALWDKSSYDRTKQSQVRDAAKENWEKWGAEINGKGGAPETLIRSEGKERLCALCLIRRLIPWRDNPIRDLWGRGKASGPLPSVSVFPSTSTMATVLYRAGLIEVACQPDKASVRQAIDGFYRVLEGTGKPADPLGRFPCWVNADKVARDKGWMTPKEFLRFDGDWYLYGEGVRNELKLPETKHRAIADAYRAMRDAAAETEVGYPPIYYALFTADGDNMGDFIGGVHKEKVSTTEVSRLLNQFAAEVPKVVHDKDSNGRVIYAGGDDVLALLPLDSALSTADTLRRKYRDLFDKWINEKNLRGRPTIRTSLSGSIVYAHHQAPLGAVLREGHSLLKNRAKKIDGKNALAMQHFHRGGPGLTFAAPWDHGGSSFADRMSDLLKKLSGEHKQVASRLFYELREHAWMWSPGGPLVSEEDDRIDFIASIIEKSRLEEGMSRKEERRKLARTLLTSA
jgi:CRISPR-associated protein Cmr2